MSKILIVDDEIEILNPLEEMLKEEGFGAGLHKSSQSTGLLHTICRSSYI